MADKYIGKHRGQPKAGYNRGRRESNVTGASHAYRSPSFGDQSVQLGLSTAANIMSLHENNRQREGNIAAGKKSMAMARHPAAGNRRAEFLSQAIHHGQAAGNNDANMSIATRSTTAKSIMHGRQAHFDMGRSMGLSGLN